MSFNMPEIVIKSRANYIPSRILPSKDRMVLAGMPFILGYRSSLELLSMLNGLAHVRTFLTTQIDIVRGSYIVPCHSVSGFFFSLCRKQKLLYRCISYLHER